MVHKAVTALENIAKPFHHETQMVAAQVERMYIGFQYQDRISQMMALLADDMGLGKTIQTIALIEHLFASQPPTEPRLVLVVATAAHSGSRSPKASSRAG